MKTDTVFYQLFQTFPSTLFQLIGEPEGNAESYQFTSVEVKQLAFRIDGLFLPPADAPQQPIYFAEVQFQKEPEFYWRFLGEIFLYLTQYKPLQDWRAVAIYARRSLEPSVPIQFQEFFASQRVRRIYLDELGAAADKLVGVGIVQLVVAAEATAVKRARQLVQQARQERNDAAIRSKIIKLIETILVYKFPRLSRQEIEAMFSLSDLKQTRVYQEAKEEGRQEGKLEGRQEGKLEIVPRLLALGLSVEQIAEALELDIEAVKQSGQ